MAAKVTLQQMLEAGTHFGHQARRWNPAMAPYIHATKQGVHIFDLVKTRQALLDALDALQKTVKEGKTILFVGTKKQGALKVEEVAKAAGMPYVTERFLGGSLTNFDQMRKSINRLTDLKEKMEKGEFKRHTKKERLLTQREIEKMEKKFGGVVDMKKLPDMLFILDTKREQGALKEAKMLGIPVVGVVDSNADPAEADFPIPANDDATKSINFIMELVKDAVTAKTKKS